MAWTRASSARVWSTRVWWVVLPVLTAASTSLRAQTSRAQSLVWFDLGGASVQQPNSAQRSAATLGAGVLHRRTAWTLAGESAVTMAADSMSAAQFVLRGAYTPVRARWSTTEVDVSATSTSLEWPGLKSNRGATVREQFTVGAVRAHVLGGVGAGSRFELSTRSSTMQVGIAATRGRFGSSAAVQESRTDDYPLAEASGSVLSDPSPHYVLRDVVLGLSWTGARVALSANHAWRRGVGFTTGAVRAPSASLLWRVSEPVALLAYGGRQLADVIRGVPQADYLGLSARWMVGARRTASTHGSSPISGARLSRDAEATLTHSPGASALTVRVRAASNATVEVASSVGDWSAQPAVRDGDSFVLRLALPSGSHRVAVRINGGAWRAPRGLIAVADDFGGTSGVVIVP